MGGGGGKGGGNSSTTTIKLPPMIEKAAKENLRIADEVAAVGFMPYQGPTVAGLSPQQYSNMQNTGAAAQAFGMAAPQASAGGKGGGIDPYTGLPMPEQYANGLPGYSPYGLYEQQIGNIAPAQDAFIRSFIIDPNTGAPPTNPAVPTPQYNPFAAENPTLAPAPAPAPVPYQYPYDTRPQQEKK